MENMFFDNWTALARVLIIGTLAYVTLIFWLRVFGKRTLSKWNAFDFVVTVAFGSTMATALLSRDISLMEGVFAFALLAALQFVVTWTSLRSDFVRKLVKSDPTLLFYQGEYLPDAMREQRVSEGEIRAAIREAGHAAMEEIEAVVLETNGNISVIKQTDDPSKSALSDVGNYDEVKKKKFEGK